MEHTNDAELEFHSDKVRHLKESVQIIQADEDMGVKYMQAWEERVWDRQEGREEGMEQKLIQLIELKLKKGQSVEQIADALEETPERIQELIDEMAVKSV